MTLTDRLNRFLNGLSRPGSHLAEFPEDIQERLVACLPKLARQFLARRHRRLIVEPEGAFAQLYFASGQERKAIGRIAVDGSSPLPNDVHELGQDHGHLTEIMLPGEAVLIRSVSFPAQVRANLPQVIRYEMDRLSPFEAKEVVFDFSFHGGAKQNDRISLDLALCRRDTVEGWIKRFNELGVPIDRISWQGAWPRANLLAPAERPRRRKMRWSLNLVFAILTLILVIAAMLTPLWQKTRLVETLAAEVKQMRAQAVTVDELRKALERAREGSTAVLQQKLDQPPILNLLRELTDRLPDDTWVQNLEYNLGQVDLRGESAQATALIALLEKASGIDGVSFKSPVTQIARTGKERFNISFTYKPQSEQ